MAKATKAVKIPGILSTVGNIVRVEPSLIKLNPRYNIREPFNSGVDGSGDPLDAEDFWIKESLRGNGWLATSPAVIRALPQTGDIILIVGHRRYHAYMELLREGVDLRGGIPCIREDESRTDAQRDLDLLTSNSGKPLSPVQRGIVCARLRAWGWTDAMIAEKAGITMRYVSDLILLANAPECAEYVKGGKASATFVVKLIRAHAENAKRILAESAKRLEAAAAKKKAEGKDLSARDTTISEGNVAPAEEKVTGEVAKVGRVPRPAGTSSVDVAAHVRGGKATRDTGKTADIVGPVRHGEGEEVADIYDTIGAKLAWCDKPEVARALVVLINQGLVTYKGKPIVDALRETPRKAAGRKAAGRKAA